MQKLKSFGIVEFIGILWRNLKPFRREIRVYLGHILVYETLQIADSAIFGMIVIDRIIPNFGMQLFVVFLVLIFVFDEVFRMWDRRVDWQITAKLWHPIYRYLKATTLKRFLDMEMAWHYKQRSGTLMYKTQDGTWKVLVMLGALGWEFVPTIVQVLVSMIGLVLIGNLAVTSIITLSFFMFMFVTYRFQKAQEPRWKVRHDLYEKESADAQEMVSFVETVSLYNQKDRLIKEHQDTLDEIYNVGIEEERVGIYHYGKWRLRIHGVARRAVLGILVFQVVNNVITVGSMVFVWTVTERLFHAFWRFARLYYEAAKSLESARRLEGVLNLEPALVDPPNPRRIL